jgi:hypothetical protein
MKESSDKVGGLDRADGDVGRRGVAWRGMVFTTLLIALCADSMPGGG